MSLSRSLKGLLIAHYFPPLNTIATHRLYSFAKYLNSSSCRLDVICPKWEGDLDLDLSSINIIHTSSMVFDKNFGKVKQNKITIFRNFILNKCLKLNYFRSRRAGSFYKEVLEKLEIMDLNSYDFILTSYAPLDSIHIGKYVKEKYTKIKWIIDYRDLYSQLEYFELGIFRFLFKKFEQKITMKADGFIAVSEILKQKQELLLNLKGKLIYNGFDDFQYKVDNFFIDKIKNIGLPIIFYSGSLYEGERDPTPFLKFIKSKKLDEKYSCVFALLNDFDEIYLKEIVNDLQIKNLVIEKNLNYEQSLSLQKFSKFLLLLSNFDGRGNGYLTGKVFEYMAAQKTIIYSGTTTSDYELYQLIVKYKLGESFEKIDYTNIQQYAPADCSFFHRKSQAAELEKYLIEICR